MLVFIDESGHPRPTDASTHPVILAVCIKESDMRTLTRALFSLRRNHLSSLTLTKEEQEGKGVAFLNRRSLTQITAKREYVESLFEFLRDFDLHTFGITMERPDKVPHESAETLPCQYRWLLERIERFMENEHPEHFALPIFDTRDPVQNRMLSESFTGYMARSAEGRAMHRIIPSPLFVDSAITPGIQIADLFAYVIRLNEEHGLYSTRAIQDPYFSAINRYVNIVKSKTINYPAEEGEVADVWYGLSSMPASKFDFGPLAKQESLTDDLSGAL
jgi:Protein of unknown function (DUF3800)